MKGIKKAAAFIMAIAILVSLVSSAMAVEPASAYSEELSKLMEAPLYAEYKLGSTITGTFESSTYPDNFRYEYFWFNKPESIPYERYYYMNVKEETAVEMTLDDPQGTIWWAKVDSGLFDDTYYVFPGTTKEVLKPGVYYIEIKNHAGKTSFTFSIKKTTLPKAKSIKFKKSSLKMVSGDIIKPETKNTPKKSVINATWSSSNKKVATVSKKGYITAKGLGSCTIKAKIKGQKAVKCTVEVTSKAVYMKNKSSKKLEKPIGAKNIQWSSSNNKVATVSSKGKVSLKKAGEVVINAKVGKKIYRYHIMSYDYKTLAKNAKTYLVNSLDSYSRNTNLKIKNVFCGFTPDRYKNRGCPAVFFKYTSDATYSKTYTFFFSADWFIRSGNSADATINKSYQIIPYELSKSKIKNFLKKFETIKPSDI